MTDDRTTPTSGDNCTDPAHTAGEDTFEAHLVRRIVYLESLTRFLMDHLRAGGTSVPELKFEKSGTHRYHALDRMTPIMQAVQRIEAQLASTPQRVTATGPVIIEQVTPKAVRRVVERDNQGRITGLREVPT